MTTTEERQRRQVRRAIDRHSFCTLATTSAENRPHVTGVLYAAADGALFVSTLRSGIKARNISRTGRAAVCIPVRRYPFAPPFCVQFQGRARILDVDDTDVAHLLDAGALKRITSHGELDAPDPCFARIEPGPRIATYGIGVPLRELIRDPIAASRSVRMG